MPWQVSVHHQGNERHPVVVIDEFADAERFREDASFLSFSAVGPHYPGVRAPVAHRMLAPLLDQLEPIVRDVFGPGQLQIVDAFYSLVTTPPERLAAIQRLPHFDEVSLSRLALLHFLSPDETSGTGFYRHRATGMEAVESNRLAAYREALDADLRRHGLPGPGYIAGDTPIFEQVALHQGRFNRALLYRSSTLHCAHIPDGIPLAADPLRGRLTVNTFLDLRP
ncbi:DUF6445 family protein [Sphingomonas xinjiangensis]|uniref:Uncharacterized protein n=1 Tax=Sphingomonas xinjiangensis TaxID=643568 RepID=A0A840YPX9_9SPHN|nr:DUF6445 family protein [Sphingomonas xinjiangensis]MBB5710242.1 hypothetical protein [Sphingomonas xinjiangensis]